jgi:hypothetical protein
MGGAAVGARLQVPAGVAALAAACWLDCGRGALLGCEVPPSLGLVALSLLVGLAVVPGFFFGPFEAGSWAITVRPFEPASFSSRQRGCPQAMEGARAASHPRDRRKAHSHLS